jgi:NitT/TauT family transport system permease protein
MKLFSIHTKISPRYATFLSMILFVVMIAGYFLVSHLRHQANPSDKITPTISQLVDGFKRSAFEKDKRNEEYRLLLDTLASTRRFFISLLFILLAVILGVFMGVFPYFEHIFLKFMTFFDKIPALALLPILFIIFGLGETSKIALIVMGVFPTICLDTYLRARSVENEQLIKGSTLGASNFEIAFRIVLPQILPGVLDTIRLNFKAMILFLIAGESLAATAGLGYRIFVVRRYLAMDIIIPYVLWMSLLALLADFAVRLWVSKRYPWVKQKR